MKLDLDSHTISLSCPGCGHERKETIGRLKAEKHFACSACGATVNVDTTKFDQGVRQAQQAIDDFEAQLRKLGKR